MAEPQYGPSPATPDVQKATIIPPVLIGITSLLHHGYPAVRIAVRRRLLVAVVRAHHRLEETSPIDLALSIEPSKLLFKFVSDYLLSYSVVKQVTLDFNKIEGRPGGALEAAWNTFERGFNDVWAMEHDFISTAGVVTNGHCGNPEVKRVFLRFR